MEDILTENELEIYRSFYHEVIAGKLAESAMNHRHDLGNHVDQKKTSVENITQVMWPYLYLNNTNGLTLETSPLHAKVLELAKALLGDDMAFDFDMLITKEGKTLTETPWHCDEAYWLDMPDKRALSFWFPMIDVSVMTAFLCCVCQLISLFRLKMVACGSSLAHTSSL